MASVSPIVIENMNAHTPGIENNLSGVTDGYTNVEIIVQDSLEKQNESRRNLEFPALTDKHIFNCFLGSGVTQGHVMELGTLLNISSDIMETLKARSAAMFALATVTYWLKNIARTNDIQYIYIELEDKLRQCHLNKVVGRLRRQEGFESVTFDLHSVKDYVVEQTKTFNLSDVFLLGQKLGLDSESIDEVIREHHATKGQQAAIAVYVEVERRHTFLNHLFVEKVTNALLEVQNRKDASSISSAILHKSLEEEVGEQTVQDVVHSYKRSLCRQWEKYFMGIFGTFISILFILLILMLTLLLVLPVLPEFPNQVISPQTVVEYHLPIDSYWISTLDLQLLGRMQCSGEAVSVQCDDIQFKTLADEETYLTSTDYIYFVEGSIITFSKRTDVLCQYCTPYYIWVFTSLSEAEKHSEDNFEHLSCANDPDSVSSCLKINESSPHVNMLVTQSSYYFIRCDRDTNCSLLANLSIRNNRQYNYEASKSKNIDVVSFHNGEVSQLKLKQQMFNPVAESSEEDVCILIKLEENCRVQNDVYHITVNGNRRVDLIFYPLIMILLIVCLPMFIVVCIKWIIKWKKK